MAKRALRRIKKPKVGQRIRAETHKQEIDHEPKPEQQQRWPPKAPRTKPPTGTGNVYHGKALYDPVYPTIKIPAALLPRYPIDWRNGGRALLCMAMAVLEGVPKIWKHSQSLRWQMTPPCSDRCGTCCSKSIWRLFCAWRIRDTGFHDHLNKMDALINNYKGPPVGLQKHGLFLVPQAVAKQNQLCTIGMRWNAKTLRYVFIDPTDEEKREILNLPISPFENQIESPKSYQFGL